MMAMAAVIIRRPSLFLFFSVQAMIMILMQASTATAQDQPWVDGNATYVVDIGGNKTMQGGCGYGNVVDQGYGLETATVSSAIFEGGAICGACYEVQCTVPEWCTGNRAVVTAIDYCPPNPSKPADDGGWCNQPMKHLVLNAPMYLEIAKDDRAGILPVQFRRTPCGRRGFIRFEIKGGANVMSVLVYNVGGAGQVTAVSVKGGSSTEWIAMARNWGQNWRANVNLVGQSMSFQVTASDGRMVQSDDAAPANWQFGQTFEGSQF